MADPVNPVPEGTVEDITGAGEAAKQTAADLDHMNSVSLDSRVAFAAMNSTLGNVTNAFTSLGSSLRGFGISLKEVGALTNQQKDLLTLAATAAIGTKTSFEGLAGVDTTGLNTFTHQVTTMLDLIRKGGPGGATALSALTDGMKKMGASDNDISKAVSKGTAALGAFAMNLFASADNALRLQNAILQLSAKTGNLNEVFELAGPHLENMNALIAKHEQVVTDAGKATGVPTEQVQKYYAQLGAVPGALSSVVKAGSETGANMNMLTAVIKVAAGTGRDYADIMGDLKTAFVDYGIVGEDALKFSTQMGEVANNLGVELTTVQGALKGTADNFKMFATNQREAAAMSSGFANILNTYVQALERTGFSGTQAVDVIKNMIGQMGNLNIAQKSFLSAQAGGPGGLMGGFQIEKMMREDPTKVMDMLRNQFKKMSGGRVVSFEEATQSQAGAAQYQRQLQMLQQGPFGALAKSPQEAERLLSALGEMDKGNVGAAKTLAGDIVQKSIERGTSVEEKSQTIMGDIAADVAAIRGVMDTSSLGMVQKAMAAGTGTGAMLDDRKIGEYLRGKMGTAAVMSPGKEEDSLAATIKKKQLIDTSGKAAVEAINNIIGDFSKDTASKVMEGPLNVLKSVFTTGGGDIMSKRTNEEMDKLKADIERRKSEAQKLSLGQRGKAMDDIRKEEDVLNKMKTAQAAVAGAVKAPARPGAQVGQAANRVTGARVAPPLAAGAATAVPGAPLHAPAAPEKLPVEVTIKGILCEKCGKDLGSAQAASVNKAANVPTK